MQNDNIVNFIPRFTKKYVEEKSKQYYLSKYEIEQIMRPFHHDVTNVEWRIFMDNLIAISAVRFHNE